LEALFKHTKDDQRCVALKQKISGWCFWTAQKWRKELCVTFWGTFSASLRLVFTKFQKIWKK
jgi:hypothetical protein